MKSEFENLKKDLFLSIYKTTKQVFCKFRIVKFPKLNPKSNLFKIVNFLFFECSLTGIVLFSESNYKHKTDGSAELVKIFKIINRID